MGTNILSRTPTSGSRGRPAPHTREVIDAIRRIVQALRESSHEAESRVGLSGAQLFILRTVAEAPGLSLNELAERTRTHQSSVSVVVTHLARKRLVEKRTADRDGRRVAISLSPGGRRRLDRAPQTAQERLIVSVDGLAASERARLGRTLERLVRGMALPRKRPAMFLPGKGAVADGSEPPGTLESTLSGGARMSEQATTTTPITSPGPEHSGGNLVATSRRPRVFCRSRRSRSSSASSPHSWPRP